MDNQDVTNGIDKLQQTSAVLKQTLQTAYEAEQVGIGTLHSLDRQRTIIESSRNKLHDTNEGLYVADRSLRRMGWRAATNRIVLICIAVALLVATILLIYFKWFDDKPKTSL